MLTDHHCHLQDSKIKNQLPRILGKAFRKDITKFICCGRSEEDWQSVLNLHDKYPEIIPAIGIHPWHIRNISEKWQNQMENVLFKYPQSLVGEIGLDLHFCKDTIEKQVEIFKTQLAIANQYRRPVSVHNLKTWHLLIPVIKQFPNLKIMLHSFSGSIEITQQLINLPNIYFSFSTAILNSSKKSLDQIILKIPNNRILLETDSPFLLPKHEKIIDQNYNEPANLIFVLEKIAKIKNIEPDFLKTQLSINSKNYLSAQ